MEQPLIETITLGSDEVKIGVGFKILGYGEIRECNCTLVSLGKTKNIIPQINGRVIFIETPIIEGVYKFELEWKERENTEEIRYITRSKNIQLEVTRLD